jgi:hypothetical protein
VNLSFLGNKRYSRSEALLYSAQCFTQEVFKFLLKIKPLLSLIARNTYKMVNIETIISRSEIG